MSKKVGELPEMGKKAGKCCKKYKQRKACKACPKKR